ncbi:MAG TPA: sugar transferase [Acidimicrobiia bacterium]|nr:sugar transferase [Acidimicrobiia bacterium]
MGSFRQETLNGNTHDGSRAALYQVDPPSLYAGRVKPKADKMLAALLLVLCAPILLSCMAVVRVFIGSPVIFRQQRVGLGGRTFELLKLRTMIPDRRTGAESGYSGPERRVTHKSPADPRVLPVGAVLRALRLDELPQLWNVITGDMSLVGPRPEIPEIVDDYEDWQHARHTVKPGITGLWQVEAPPGRLMHECTELDLQYIDDLSLRTDLEILLRTPLVAFRRQGY